MVQDTNFPDALPNVFRSLVGEESCGVEVGALFHNV